MSAHLITRVMTRVMDRRVYQVPGSLSAATPSADVICCSSECRGDTTVAGGYVGDGVCVRIAYVTESFPPDVNGVAHTAVRVSEQLASRGHEPLVIAPEPAGGLPRPDGSLGYPVVRVPSMPVPVYPGLRVGLPARRVQAAMAEHGTDLVHLAGPFVLGASGCAAARRLGLPIVAVYATDMAAYARTYHAGSTGEKICWRWVRRLHNAAGLTLAPSSATAGDLRAHGVQRVDVWGRGVDTGRFHPAKRSPSLRAELAPSGEVIVGYVGRLAAEKRLDLLSEVAALPGARLVIVGGGPAETEARRALPGALFLGQPGRRPRGHLRQPRRVRAQRTTRHVRQHAAGGRRERPAGRGTGRGRPHRPGGRGSDRLPGHSR